MSAAHALKSARAAGIHVEIHGNSILLEAASAPPTEVLDMLRANKPEILKLLQSERRAVVQYIANYFQTSLPGRCIHCGGDERADDPSVAIFCGSDSAELHARCYPEWFALQEFEARTALGIDQPDKQFQR